MIFGYAGMPGVVAEVVRRCEELHQLLMVQAVRRDADAELALAERHGAEWNALTDRMRATNRGRRTGALQAVDRALAAARMVHERQVDEIFRVFEGMGVIQ